MAQSPLEGGRNLPGIKCILSLDALNRTTRTSSSRDSNHLGTITKSDAIYVLLLVWKMALKMFSVLMLSFCQWFSFQTVLKLSGGHPVHGSQRWSKTTWVHFQKKWPHCTKSRMSLAHSDMLHDRQGHYLSSQSGQSCFIHQKIDQKFIPWHWFFLRLLDRGVYIL